MTGIFPGDGDKVWDEDEAGEERAIQDPCRKIDTSLGSAIAVALLSCPVVDSFSSGVVEVG